MNTTTPEEVRKAIDAVRRHHKRPQNGSLADAYQLLADIAERVIENGCLLAIDHSSACEQLPDRPPRCSECGWSLGQNWGCAPCSAQRETSENA